MNSTNTLCAEVIRHLGGEARLKEIGARVAGNDAAQVSLRLIHPNPRGVRSIVISLRSNGLYAVDCFGPMRMEAFRAERIGHAEHVSPYTLANVVGALTGLECLQNATAY
ncbi:MAG: hypothetical protein CTY15_03845 [Methylocystis sp.]|nr:MAG: hypothetical protein CTY15_03845 [Methylocystis sp.]